MFKFSKIIICISLFFAAVAHGAISPIGLDIVPPVEFPPSDFSVTGLRLGLVGHHRDMYGVDLAAIGNITDQTFTGIAVSGIFNYTMGTTTAIGLQAAAITNVNMQKTKVVGVEFSLVNYLVAESTIIGLQIGPFANIAPHTTIYGIQAGLYNRATEVYGFQIGLFNFVSSLHGLQIGLLNFNAKGLFSVCPILNFGF